MDVSAQPAVAILSFDFGVEVLVIPDGPFLYITGGSGNTVGVADVRTLQLIGILTIDYL